MEELREKVHAMKLISPALAASNGNVRNDALLSMAEALERSREDIFAANEKDMSRADGIKESVRKRLKFDEGKLNACVEGLKQLAALDDPIGRTTLYRELDEGLELKRVTVPIGVVGVIFEARPDALVQIAGLCVKSGNCVILKGGKEAEATNTALFDVLEAAVRRISNIPEGIMLKVSSHGEIDELLKLDGDIDLIIPRGSNAFVRHIMENTRIPVMGHADGICHIYVDRSADLDMATDIITDAKTQYPAACNAAETVLVDREVSQKYLPVLAAALRAKGVSINGDSEIADITEVDSLIEDPKGYRREYGDMTIALKLADGVRDAAEHINRYGSHHTDAIIAQDDEAADTFFKLVDSAGVYRNCSTRFADGFRYGFGAEVGISTGKLHARGPVGLEGLTSYKYLLEGSGQSVREYAEGTRAFHYREL